MAFRQNIFIPNRLCLVIKFKSEIKNFSILTKDGRVFYVREFVNPTDFAMVNINEKGYYTIVSESPVLGMKVQRIKIPNILKLPKPDWNFVGVMRMVKSDMNPSPASTIPSKRIMFINSKMKYYPIGVANFVIGHEHGHQLYKSEELCDLFAINWVLQRGGNLSMCLYALEKVLNRTPQNILRIKEFMKNVMKSNYYGRIDS